MSEALPFIDVHEVSLDVPVDQAWPLVVAAFSRMTGRPAWSVLAKALGCRPDRAIGAPENEGASLPGFHVAQSDEPTRWGLEGSHHFARYALTFRITPLDGGRSQVAAESSASFPGIRGAGYRALIIGTGGHGFGVRRILRQIQSDARRDRIARQT